ncbi:MAG: hypothetical protein PHR45_08840 [Muribaculaceae bacterium]|nr:hypothetical protein [Muribaculaceae bacterium]
MKELLKFSFLGIFMALLSCGGGGASGDAGKFISDAEVQTPVVSNKYFGDLPGLKLQKKAAKSLADEKYTAEGKAIKTDDLEEGLKQLAVIGEKAKATEAEIDTYYDKKNFDAIEALKGKEVPATFDPAAFESVKCVIERNDSASIIIKTTMVLACDFPKSFANLSWEYRDAAGAKLSAGAYYLPKDTECVKGSTVEMTIENPPIAKLEKFEGLYFFK